MSKQDSESVSSGDKVSMVAARIEQTPSRHEIWIRAWCAVAGAWNCHSSEAATRWADDALVDFEKRFMK